jgi:hypothetical protein
MSVYEASGLSSGMVGEVMGVPLIVLRPSASLRASSKLVTELERDDTLVCNKVSTYHKKLILVTLKLA